jgi:hypothetical protein
MFAIFPFFLEHSKINSSYQGKLQFTLNQTRVYRITKSFVHSVFSKIIFLLNCEKRQKNEKHCYTFEWNRTKNNTKILLIFLEVFLNNLLHICMSILSAPADLCKKFKCYALDFYTSVEHPWRDDYLLVSENMLYISGKVLNSCELEISPAVWPMIAGQDFSIF